MPLPFLFCYITPSSRLLIYRLRGAALARSRPGGGKSTDYSVMLAVMMFTPEKKSVPRYA